MIDDFDDNSFSVLVPDIEATVRAEAADYERDGPYVADQLQGAIDHFRSRDIGRLTIAKELAQAVIKLASGNPYEALPDKTDLDASFSCLWAAFYPLEMRIKAFERAFGRIKDK